MKKYEVLINTLDQLRREAPSTFVAYHPDQTNQELINQARSKAFIHLFLKVKFGLLNFNERHMCITDGVNDGGVDAYYLDQEHKKLYLIQSKFRSTKENFEAKSITADELVKIDVSRILKGETTSSAGYVFSSKIQEFQRLWRGLGDQVKYDVVVIILGNLTKYSDEQIKRLLDHTTYQLYDFERTYLELVFPLCRSTFFSPGEILITLNLFEKDQPILKQKVSTKYGDFQVRLIFVPASEIGRVLSKYKNSILLFNPRNYLSLSRNKVNKRIRDSVVDLQTNDFAILNNGITLVAEQIKFSEQVGTTDVGQVILKDPQIINGGQTAYTLSKIYDENLNNLDAVFKGKEVMIKAIILKEGTDLNVKFLQELSDSTNQQSKVEEADRRSNDEVQIQLQKEIFQKYGYFYERKKGEFFNGLDRGFIDKSLVIRRDAFIRSYLAFKGNPSDARRSAADSLFKQNFFAKLMDGVEKYPTMFFAYLLYDLLNQIESCNSKSKWLGFEEFANFNFGSGLRYGKFAIIAAAGLMSGSIVVTSDLIESSARDLLKKVLSQWHKFETEVMKDRYNILKYAKGGSKDFDNYYKGSTVRKDIVSFFKP